MDRPGEAFTHAGVMSQEGHRGALLALRAAPQTPTLSFDDLLGIVCMTVVYRHRYDRSRAESKFVKHPRSGNILQCRDQTGRL